MTKNLTNLSIQPDGWGYNFETLTKADDFKDSSFPGCQYRLQSCGGDLAVNVKITGRKSHDISSLDYTHTWYKTRVKIEYVGDGEPSTFDGAWVFSGYPLV